MDMHLEDDRDVDQFCVKWSNHHGTVISVLETLLNDETYVDCTLAAEGQEISAHKVVLSACSPFLNRLLKKHYDKHPIILLRDVTFNELQSVIEYMYKGEVNMNHEQLSSFLKAAESLQVAGLSGVRDRASFNSPNATSPVQRTGGRRARDKTLEVLESMEVEQDMSVVLEEESESSVEQLDQQLDQALEESTAVSEQSEAVEYLTDEDSQEVNAIKIKNEFGNYQVYVVDHDTGALKAVDVLSEGGGEVNSALEALEEGLKEAGEGGEEEGGEGGEVVLEEKEVKGERTRRPRPKLRPKSVINRDEYNISCTKCGGLYKHESSFLNHLRHDCNQVHTCEACQKSFKNKRHLLDHVRDDCGRVHVCPRCNKYFKQKVNLTTHMKHYCRPEKGQGLDEETAAQELEAMQ